MKEMKDANLAGTGEQSTQQSAIVRLLQADADANERRDQAQKTSRSMAMDTEAKATRLLEEARTDATRATQYLVEQARKQAQLDAQQITEEAKAAAEEMTNRAHQQLDDAVAFVVAWVSGEDL
jgi:vacuolar-type H+-ATPase subunit H